MKHELDRMMDLIKDYKTGYGGVTDSFMRKELEMFAKDYHSEQCNKADVVISEERTELPEIGCINSLGCACKEANGYPLTDCTYWQGN